jgi:hypothetical protein
VIDFIVRLVGYALLLGVSSRIAQTAWADLGLDAYDVLQPLHAAGIAVLLVAPVLLALLGTRVLRLPCVFVAFALAGAALTAPYVIARVAGV